MKSFYCLRDACSQASFLLPVQPLTRCHAEGEPYHRAAPVTRPIDVALKLSPAVLIKRAAISDSDQPDFLQAECLVYLRPPNSPAPRQTTPSRYRREADRP